MKLLAVELASFRNVAAALVEPHPRFNVLSGENGQGKTNFLEAVYLLGTLRSFRANKLEELVRFAEPNETLRPSARASARVERAGVERRFDVEVWAEPPRKQARVDGKPVRASADYFGGFNVVLFVPDDLRLPRGAPSARRRFLDRAVWNVEPAFLKDAQAYERVLKSRNALLRDLRSSPANPELLAVYDEQLATHGASLISRRRQYLSALSPRLAAAFERISRSGLALEVRYESEIELPQSINSPESTKTPESINSSQSIKTPESINSSDPNNTAQDNSPAAIHAALLDALTASRARDRAVGYTTAGPHTDDIAFFLDGRPARLYASQGQLRAIVLALKVAEIGHLENALGDSPVLLLDDVSSELDPARNRFLFEFLSEVSGQVFITTTDPAHVLLARERRDFRVTEGAVSGR